MKIERASLLKELQFLSLAIEKKATIPILSTMKIEVEKGRANLTATDLDLTANTSIEAEGDASYCLPFHDLLNVVRNSSGEFVEIETTTRAHIKCGKGKFSIPFFDIKDFPMEPEFKPENEIEFEGAFLSSFLRLSSFAGDGAQTYQPSRQSVHIRNNGKLTGFTTNDAIAAIAEADSPTDKELIFSIPLSAIPAIRQICDQSEDVTLRIEHNHIGITGGDRSIIARRIVGNCPNYDLIRKPDENHTAIIDHAELQGVVKASQSLDDLVLNQDGRFTSLLFERVSDTNIKVSSERSEAAFESDFEAEGVTEFPAFKVNTFQLQRLLTATDKNTKFRAIFDKPRTVIFADSDGFRLEFIQANLNF